MSVINNNLKIKKLLDSAKKIALFGHNNPDGDCIGAMLGMGKLLSKQSKKVSYFTPSKPSVIFDFVKGVSSISSEFDYAKYDLLVFLDFSGYDRISKFTKGNEKYFDENNILVIDHHPGEHVDHGFLIKDIAVMSTCELVFENTYKWWKKYYDSDIATCFYMGLTTDSGNFLYDIDHCRILKNALELVRLGADKSIVINNLFRKKSFGQIKFTQLLLERVKIKGDLLYSYYTDDELIEYNIDQEQAQYPLTIVQNIDGPRVFLLIKKIGNKIGGSLRTKDTPGKVPGKKGIDCQKIAKDFGGGGHKFAAGFTLEFDGNLEKQIEKITTDIVNMI